MLFSHGFLILDKPVGISSAKAVAEVKRLLKCKKIGHGGTLDPLASGVLPLAIGEATKAFSYVVSAVKQYRFTITFGEERTTADAEGEVTARTDIIPSEEDIMRVLPEFVGTIMQTPPAYSAISIGGKRAYAMARAGEAVELAARPVEIFELRLEESDPSRESRVEKGIHTASLADSSPHRGEVRWGAEMAMPLPVTAPSLTLPLQGREFTGHATRNLQLATFSVTCGKGTYVRSLAQDIARKCNSLGYVSMLRRVSVGRFHEQNAISLDNLKETVYKAALAQSWVPIELALDDIPAIDVDAGGASLLRHGQTIPVHRSDGGYMTLLNGHIVALAEVKGGRLRTKRVFNL